MNLVKAYRSILSAKECFTRYRRLILAGILLINVVLILDAAEGKKERNNYKISSEPKHPQKRKDDYEGLAEPLRKQSPEEWRREDSGAKEENVHSYEQPIEKHENVKKEKPLTEINELNNSDSVWRQKEIYVIENEEQEEESKLRRRWLNNWRMEAGDGVAQVDM